MFRIERSAGDGNWHLMMSSPHRIGVDDLHGPLASGSVGGGDIFAGLPSPGKKTAFAGEEGWEARVRYEDTVIERFIWDKIPLNEFDPESETIWGWKMVQYNHAAIPPDKLWSL